MGTTVIIEGVWLFFVLFGLGETMYAIVEAARDLSAVKTMPEARRLLQTARGNIRREVLRLVVQVAFFASALTALALTPQSEPGQLARTIISGFLIVAEICIVLNSWLDLRGRRDARRRLRILIRLDKEPVGFDASDVLHTE